MIRHCFSSILRGCWRFAFIAILTSLLGVPVDAQTWDGGGANNNWTNGINWVGDVAPVNNGTANIIMAGIIDPAPVVDVAQSIRSLTFNNTAGIFTISGSPLTITNAAGITNNDADTQTINSSIVLGATQTWTAASGNLVVAGNISPSAAVDLFVAGANNLTLSGILSGTLGINKFAFETGTLTLSGASANTYTRDTAISGGTVVLSKTTGVNAIPGGTLTVGDFAGVANDDVLRLGASNQIADATNVVIDSAGLFDLNGFNETVNGTLTMSDGNITTGVGTLTLGGNVTAIALAAATISGKLGLTGQRTFTVNDGSAAIELDIPATITGGGIIKAGAGRMRLGASNTFSTSFRIDAGTVQYTNNGAFGTGTIQFNGGVITSNGLGIGDVANNIVIAGNVGFGTPAEGGYSAQFAGNITLSGGDRSITFADMGLGTSLTGSIGQDVAGRSLTIDGTSAVAFAGSTANTYTGTTTVNGGTLDLTKSIANGAILGNLVIGDGTGLDDLFIQTGEQINDSSTVTINSSGLFRLRQDVPVTETIGNLVMTRGIVDCGKGTLVVTGAITINASSAAATIQSSASGSSGSLSLNGSNKTFTIPDGTATFDLDISAAVSNGSLTKDGPGTMRLSGGSGSSNTYSGATTVNAGTLVLSKTSAVAIAGPLVIGDGLGGVNSDVVRWDASNQFGAISPVVNASGLLNLNGANGSVLGITLNGGNVTTGSGTLGVNGLVTSNASAQTASISGNINSGVPLDFEVANGAAAIDLDVSAAISTSFGLGIIKNGAGTLRLGGTNTYADGTSPNAAGTTLNLGVVEVSADANLGGPTGFVTFNGGTLRTSASLSTSRTITLQSGGGTIETFAQTTLTGPISGTGALTKTNAGTLIISSVNGQVGTLNVSSGGFELADGASFNVTGATTVSSGTLVVLENNSHFTAGSFDSSGEITLDGTLATLQTDTLTNSGIVRGRGRIQAVLSNSTGGEVRATSGDLLQFIETVGSSNGGRINLLGGTVEFTQSSLTNLVAGQIVGNGTLDANSIVNAGTMAFSGLANVLGNVNNISSAKIISSGGGPATFFDDVVNNGEIRTSPGSFSVFFGSVSGTGTFTGTGTVNMEGDLSPGASPAMVNFAGNLGFGPSATLQIEIGGTSPGSQYDKLAIAGQLVLDGILNVGLIDLGGGQFAPHSGDSFDILDWGTLSGTFSAIQLPALTGGLQWNTSQLYTTGVLSVASAGLPGDFNNNGVLDAADYVVWRKGLGTTFTQSDYDTWRAHFGQTAGSGAALEEFATRPVPEPGAFALLLAVSAIVRHTRMAHGRRPIK